MEHKELVIVLDFVPPTINKYIGRSNIWQYQEEKKKFHELVMLSTVGINPKIKKCKMKVVYYFKTRIRHDPSNYDKMLLDGLVHANIIEDDSYEVIQEFTTIGKYDKMKPRTEVYIQECS